MPLGTKMTVVTCCMFALMVSLSFLPIASSSDVPIMLESADSVISDGSMGPFNNDRCVRINEAYPDPDMDINGDGIVDQNDEFIELFNCGDESVDIDGWTVSDNGGSFTIRNVNISGRGYLYLPRTLTKIVLGANENISLSDGSSNYVDHLAFENAKKGMSYHRAPDGSDRLRALKDPTPGLRNHLPPTFLINEVMPDPVGKNALGQWAELLNLGDTEDLKGARLTNTESVDLILPSLVLGPGERAIICIGNADRLGPRPPEVRLIQIGSSSTLYVVGDELQLIDPEGYSMDYVAWGSSSHVGAPLALPGGSIWLGRVWDRDKSSMSENGSDNPIVIEGRSLMRSPDAVDTDSPEDWTPSPSILKSTPGWSNDQDISLLLSCQVPKIEFDPGQERIIDLNISIPGCNMGNITLNITLEKDSWAVTNEVQNTIMVTGENLTRIAVCVRAPEEIREHKTSMTVYVSWEGREWYIADLSLELLIPSVDLLFEDVWIASEHMYSDIIPQGLFIDIEGYVKNRGDIKSGEFTVDVRIAREGSDELILDRIRIDGASPGKRRVFRSSVDTLELEGNWTIVLCIDREDEISEFDEGNNIFFRNVSILPTPVAEGEAALLITSVLWNTTMSERFTVVSNPTSSPVDLSMMYITDGRRSVRFPEGSVIWPQEDIGIAWGGAAIERVTWTNRTFRCDDAEDKLLRMVLEGALPDPSSTGYLSLNTRYRKHVDIVSLKRGTPDSSGWSNIGPDMVETTYGTVTMRVSRDGRYLDTNTSLDWYANSGHARLHSFSPSPSSGTSSEFVSLKLDVGVDPSGFMLLCNRRVAVLANGTRTGPNGVITIAGNLDLFKASQGSLPDIVFGEGGFSENGVLIPGAKVPGYSSLVLPNDGAALFLIDPSGRVVDSVEWGSNGIGSVQSDMVLLSRWDESMVPRWSVGGRGSFPIIPSLMYGGIGAKGMMLFSEVSEGLRWLEGHGDLLAFTCHVDTELASLAESALSDGFNVTMYVGHDLSGTAETDPFTGAITYGTDLAVHLEDIGAKVYFREGPPVSVNAYVRGSRSFIAFGDRVGNGNSTSAFNLPGLGYELMDHRDAVALMRMMVGREEDWSDLSEGGPVDHRPLPPREGKVNTDRPVNALADLDISSVLLHPASTLPEVIMDQEEVFIFDVRGNMDLPGILRSLDDGTRIRLLLGPGCISPTMDRNKDLSLAFMDRMDRRLSDLVQPEQRNHLHDAVSMHRYAQDNGLDLQIRIFSEDPTGLSYGGLIRAGSWTYLMMDKGSGRSNPFWIGHTCPEISYLEPAVEILWSRSNPLPWGFIGDRDDEVFGSAHSGLVIDEIYPDTYLPGDADEYVRIVNRGSRTISLRGCSLSDNEGMGLSGDGTVFITDDLLLGPGDDLFLSWSREDFTSQNGFGPHLALDDRDRGHSGLFLVGTPRLANENDSVCLRDPEGVVLDVVPYGRCVWESKYWPRAEGGSWTGPAVPMPGSGHVLHRARDHWGGPISDNDAKADWLSLRPRYPGQSRYGPFEPSSDAKLRFGVCPDTSSDILRDIIENARSELLVNIYEMNSAWITAAMLGARERGVEVKMLFEGQPVGGISWDQRTIMEYLMAGGVDVKVMYNDPSGIRDSYRFDHAKYIVADGARVLISSDNFKDTSFPPQGRVPSTGTRGWVAIADSIETAQTVKRVFEDDWSGPDVRATVLTEEVISDLTSIFRPEMASLEGLDPFPLEGEIKADSITVLVSPDHLSQTDNPLIRAISGAEHEVVVQLMSLSPSFDTASQRSAMVPEPAPGSLIYGTARSENPYLSALFNAAGKGVRVRIMLDGTDFDMDGRADNEEIAKWVEAEAFSRGVGGNITVKVMPATSLLPGRNIGLFHNKGAVIDSRYCWLSSLNWGPTSALENREMGFLIESEDMGREMMRILDADWGLTLQNDLKLHKEGMRISIIDKDSWRITLYVRETLGISEGAGLMLIADYTIGHTLPENGWTAISSKGNITCIEYQGSIPDDGRFHIIGREGNRSAFLMEVRVSQIGEDGSDELGYPFHREPLFPVIVVLVSALLLSIAISAIRNRKHGKGLRKGAIHKDPEE